MLRRHFTNVVNNNNNNEEGVDLTLPYVTFTAEKDNSLISLVKLSTNQILEYSRDTTTWSNMSTSTYITLANVGDEVYIRGILSNNNSTSDYTQFKMTGKIAASGNCNALWNYQDLNAPLNKYCGYRLFYECTSLVTPPELPATTLANYCYCSMFEVCSSLTTAPELPATTLSSNCYENMFYRCSSLETMPELPATKLVLRCYYLMFRGSNIDYIKCLATDISASSCTKSWVSGVPSSGTFVKHPDMNKWTTGINGIPSGWTVVDA